MDVETLHRAAYSTRSRTRALADITNNDVEQVDIIGCQTVCILDGAPSV